MAKEMEPLTKQLNLRLSQTDMERLSKQSGLVPRSIIARAAIRLGLDIIESDQSAVMRVTSPNEDEKPGKTSRR